MADLENGLYPGWENGQDRNISTNTPVKYDFVSGGDTAEKNGCKGRFAVHGGDGTTGVLKEMYDPRTRVVRRRPKVAQVPPAASVEFVGRGLGVPRTRPRAPERSFPTVPGAGPILNAAFPRAWPSPRLPGAGACSPPAEPA
jgi:hypothetical protein